MPCNERGAITKMSETCRRPTAKSIVLLFIVILQITLTESAGVVRVQLTNFSSNITTKFTSDDIPRIARICLRPTRLTIASRRALTSKTCLTHTALELPMGELSNVVAEMHFTHQWTPSFKLLVEIRYDVHGIAKLDDFDSISIIGPVATQTIEHTVFMNAGEDKILKVKFHSVNKTETRSTIKLEVSCDQDWYGETCSTFCKAHNTVNGHYTCAPSTGDKVCLSGWTTTNSSEPCTTPVCDSDCGGDANGVCVEPNVCSCRSGWRGADCTECIPYPNCAHGTCNLPGECICDSKYGGPLCSVDLNYCEHQQPCANGGTCFAGKPCLANELCEYTCECPKGFAGKDCQIEEHGCDEEPCVNGGVCHTKEKGEFTCECSQGFKGEFCELKNEVKRVKSGRLFSRNFRPTIQPSTSSCFVDNVWHAHGEEWTTDTCQLCSCKNSHMTCTPSTCSTLDCRPSSSPTADQHMCPSTQVCLSVVNGDCLSPPCNYPFGQCIAKDVVHSGERREICRDALEVEEKRSLGSPIETDECARVYVSMDWASIPVGTNMKTVCHYITLTLHTRGLTQYAAFCDVKRNDSSTVYLQVDLVTLQHGWPMHGIASSLSTWLTDGRSPFDVLLAIVRVDYRLRLRAIADLLLTTGRQSALPSPTTTSSSAHSLGSPSSRVFEYVCLAVIVLLCVVIGVMFVRVKGERRSENGLEKNIGGEPKEKGCNLYAEFQPNSENVCFPPIPPPMRAVRVPPVGDVHDDVGLHLRDEGVQSEDDTIYEQVDEIAITRQNEENEKKIQTQANHDLVTQYEASV